jgi:hypothetical protein
MLCALALGGGLALGGAARGEDAAEAAATPTIYKWVDTNGIAHYTTDLGRVPRSVRGSVRALGTPSPGEGFAARDAGSAAPGTEAAAPPPEWDQGSAAEPAAPAPAAPGRERWAASDRPSELPGEESESVGAAGAAQTAAAEPAAAPAPSPEAATGSLRDLDQRIAALEAEIATDEEALKGFLAAPAPGDPGEIAYDRSFREVAERLPKRLAELRTLQSERAQLDQP